MRSAVLAVVVFAALIGVGSPAEAQLWKPAKPTATTTTAPTRPAAAKPARSKRVRRTTRPARPAPRRTVVRDEAPRDRDADRGDGIPEFDNAPLIVVEKPGRGER